MNLLSKIKQVSLRIFIGVLSGFIFGVVARLWMRWISTEPEFTWSGSIFIVSGFVVFATSQSIIGLLRNHASDGCPSIDRYLETVASKVSQVCSSDTGANHACKGLYRHSFRLRVECGDNRSVTLVCLDLFDRNICDSSNRFGALVTALSSPTSGKAIVDLSSI